MLVLTRKLGERIRLGDDMEIVVSRIGNKRVSLGIRAPRDVEIVRPERVTNDVVEQKEGPSGS